MSPQKFVVLMFCEWKSVETALGIPLSVKMEDGSVGFLPVFETREEAQAEYPNFTVLEIHENSRDVPSEQEAARGPQ